MTFLGIVSWLSFGYLCGLFLPALIPWLGKTRASKISVRGGVTGGLGASTPYVLLHSIWVQQAVSSPAGSWFQVLLGTLVAHISSVCVASCIVCAVVEELATQYEARRHAKVADADVLGPTRFQERRRFRQEIWLALCLPAAIFTIAKQLSDFSSPLWINYFVGAMAFLGLAGYLVSVSIRSVRS